MKRLLSLFALLFSLSASAQGPVLADEVAAIVGNSTVLLSDIERQTRIIENNRKTNGTLSKQTPREEAFETLILQNLLSQRARRDSLDKTMEPVDGKVEQELARLINEAGSISVLEKKMGKPIYQIRSSLTSIMQDMSLAQLMQYKVQNDIKITYDEVVDFSKKIPTDSMQKVPEQYAYSKIVRMPPQTDERKYEIRERLLEYRRQILDGKKFSVLARLYSMDGTALNGGEMGPQSKREFVGSFVNAAEALEPGQVSEIVETEYGQHIIELISKKNDMLHIRHILLKPEFTIEESALVKSELDSIAKEVNNGRLNFKSAAMKYSDDVSSRANGGRAFNLQGYYNSGDLRLASTLFLPDDFERIPLDYVQLRKLEVGQASESFETMDEKGNIVQQIVYLDRKVPAHVANLKNDYDVLEMYALRVKQNEHFEKWLEGAIKDMYVEIMPAFKDYNFERPMLNSKRK